VKQLKWIFIGILLISFWACSPWLLGQKTVFVQPEGQSSDSRAEGKNYMITTQGPHASKAGAEIFELGGNAIDAAVAVSFTIGVERPQSTGIGGGGFLLYLPADQKKPVAYDFREVAPLTADRDIFVDKKGKVIPRKSIDGIHSAGVPGLVAGLVELHEKYGKLPLATVMQPAIRLAREGFEIYPELAYALKRRGEKLHEFESSRKIFFKKEGVIYKLGDTLVQKDLAETLELIASKGKKGFYQGKVAEALIRTAKKYGGLMRQKDLDSYEVKVREPVSGEYKGHQIFSMSPPSSGGIHIIQILNTIAQDNLGDFGVHDPRTVHLVASAMQQAFSDRALHLGDSDFVEVPMKRLTSKDYAQEVRSKVSLNEARKPEEVHAMDVKKAQEKMETFEESNETTHFTIMDAKGNVVSSTQTINGYFGSALVAEGTGIVLNNEMNDFTTKPGEQNIYGAVGGEKNIVEPRKRPLSSMSPTIVTNEQGPVLSLGSPSGTRILTCVALTIMNYLEHGLSLEESVTAVRYHQQWYPDLLIVEERGLPDSTMKRLKQIGHEIMLRDYGCRIQAVAKEGDNLIGVSDPRGAGMALGK